MYYSVHLVDRSAQTVAAIWAAPTLPVTTSPPTAHHRKKRTAGDRD